MTANSIAFLRAFLTFGGSNHGDEAFKFVWRQGDKITLATNRINFFAVRHFTYHTDDVVAGHFILLNSTTHTQGFAAHDPGPLMDSHNDEKLSLAVL